MAGIFTAREIDGKLPSTSTILYQANGAGVIAAYIKTMTFKNKGVVEETLEIIKNNGVDIEIPSGILNEEESAVSDDNHTLEVNGSIKGKSTNANVVHYTISLLEET